ncbi:LOG family protein [Senegalimassilia sp.]|uniref:LOG family protein n=1 Tax=Senegalimassilia sp. TaxID=1922200 RepID=UPI0031F2E7E4
MRKQARKALGPFVSAGFAARCPVPMPGGTGTLEEVSEVISLIALAQLDAPCILFNLNGFYDDLRALLNRMSDMGLSSPRRQRGIHFAHALQEVADILAPLH